MSPFTNLPAFDPKSGLLNAVVDTPKGSRGKYKLDEDSGLFRLSKLLPLGMAFPYNFGFIPGTRGEDDDALDVLLIMDEPVFIGSIVPLKLIGVVKAEQTELDGRTVRNDRLLGVLETPQNPPELFDISEMHPRRLDDIEHFFISYNEKEGRRFTPLGREGAKAAFDMINAAITAR
ncbi:MAG: inorganic diphosphatase [Asticcacaulis sp.]